MRYLFLSVLVVCVIGVMISSAFASHDTDNQWGTISVEKTELELPYTARDNVDYEKIKISGTVAEPGSATWVYITITKPDGKTLQAKSVAVGRGDHGAYVNYVLICCNNLGTYTVSAEWKGHHIGTVTINVVEKSTSTSSVTPPTTSIPLQETTASTITYTDPENRFSIDYPSDWIQEIGGIYDVGFGDAEATITSLIMHFPNDGSSRDIGYLNFVKLLGKFSCEDVTSYICSNYEVKETKTLDIDINRKAFLVKAYSQRTYEDSPHLNHPYTTQHVLIPAEDYDWIIVSQSKEHIFENNSDRLLQMIKSFRLLEPSTSIPLQETTATTATVTTEASSGQLYTELIKFLPNHIFQDTVTIPYPVAITLPVKGFVSGIKQTYIENTPGGGSEKPCKIFCSKPYRDKYTIDFWIFKFDSGVNALNFAKGLDRNDYGIHGGLQHVSSSSIESGLLQIEAPNLVTSCESTYWQNKERGTFWHNFIGTQGGKKTCVFANYVLSSNIQTEEITQEYNYHIGETYWLPNIIYPVIAQIESSFIESGNTDIFKLTPNSKQIKEYGIYKITDAKIIHGSNDDLIVLNIKGNINWEIMLEHPERTDVRFRLYDNGLIPSWSGLVTSWSSETLSETHQVTWGADGFAANTVKNPTFAFPNETCTKDVTVLAQEKGKPAETKLCFEVSKGMDSFVLAKVPEDPYPCSYNESSSGWWKLIGQCKNESVQKFAAFDREDIEGGTNIFSTKSTKGGGCLIATAAFGSEMAPQVQFLRELRDNTVLQTESGTSFMTSFNQFYYSFSPAIADYERENPAFKEMVKLALTPLLTSLTLLQYADIDSESEMLGYGIGVILLNIGMYFIAPAVLLMKIRKRI
jgi:hypothetical protein